MVCAALRLTMPWLVVGALLLSACSSVPKLTAPTVPPAPQVPGVAPPAVPLPGAVQAPAVPPLPGAPALPGVPALPGAPQLPAVPQVPGAPTAAQLSQLAAAQAAQVRMLDLSVVASADLNADGRNRAAPVVMRVYQLRSTTAFLAADFFSLFDREQAALGPELLAREELQLRPSDTQRLSREAAPGARAIGVIVAYRDLERSNWRAVVPLPDPDPAVLRIPGKAAEVPLRIRLGARAVVLEKP